jgi:hypothetical protein
MAQTTYKFIQIKNFKPTVEVKEAGKYECAICYKAINKTCFVCSDPCNKVFHQACLEEAFQQAEDNADEEDEVAEHRCCYCRRHVNMNQYELELMGHTLRSLRNSNGYSVQDALDLIQYNITNDIENEDDEFNIYLPKNQSNDERKPKQSKQAVYKNKIKSRHLSVRKNYGMRR